MNNLKNIPSMDEILNHSEVDGLIKKYNRGFVLRAARQVVTTMRGELRQYPEELGKDQIMPMLIGKLINSIENLSRPTLQHVINGTGVVLHTNLGRAPLGEKALFYLMQMGGRYNNLEMDLEKGERGSRYGHVEELIRAITGAEAALVVNNNAAAVMLGLTTLGKNREVIVSRGQLVEIGGAFRIPEVMKLSGARLVEVGTTNKTYLADYAQAITEETALLFSAHTSNYKIVGFSAEVKIEELVALGRERNLPVMQDLGSGILLPLEQWGLREEPTVQECIASGVDVLTFSGDKLLGGPQAGIIAGKKEYIEAMKNNQLLRALRVDKLTIAALEGTLLEYLAGNPMQNIPVLRMLSSDIGELRKRSMRLKRKLQAKLKDHPRIESLKSVVLEDMVGGGAFPTHKLPGHGVEIRFRGINLEEVALRLRRSRPALLTRKQENSMLISVRTLLDREEDSIVELLAEVISR